jgi:hypothetical protein
MDNGRRHSRNHGESSGQSITRRTFAFDVTWDRGAGKDATNDGLAGAAASVALPWSTRLARHLDGLRA